MNTLFIGSSSVGPRWIMSTLKKNGHGASGIFMGYEDTLVGEMAVPFLPSVDKGFLKTNKIGIVGLTVDSLNVDKARRISQMIKEGMPEIRIIWGGIHPTVEPYECIGYPEVDYICLGEGEYPMLELCEALEVDKGRASDENIRNIWAKKGDRIFKNPLREYIDINTVEFDREGIVYNGIYTSRGCAGDCAFCMSPYLKKDLGINGTYFRNRRVDLVIDEISDMIKANNKYLLNQIIQAKTFQEKIKGVLALYRINKEPIRIKDDSFLLNKKWFFEFAERFSGKFRFRGYICSARVPDINEKVAEALKKSNCRMIILGFESGDERYRNKVLNKQVTDAQIYKAAGLLREAGIPILGQWMIGMPGETPDEAIKSLRMSLAIGDIPQVHIATPFPKTKMADIAVKSGYLSDGLNIHPRNLYEDFTMIPKEQRDVFRLIYNAFQINSQKLNYSRWNMFDRFYYEIRKLKNLKIGDILLKDTLQREQNGTEDKTS